MKNYHQLDEWERRFATSSVRRRIDETFDVTISDLKRRIEETERAKKACLEYYDAACKSFDVGDLDEARKAGEFCSRYLSGTIFDLSRNNNTRLDLFGKAEIGVTALFNICPF